MKKLIPLTILLLFTLCTMAQKEMYDETTLIGHYSPPYLKSHSDILTIPVGKYQFIKVGDKVYKLVTTFEEVKPSIDKDERRWLIQPNFLTDSTHNVWQNTYYTIPAVKAY